MPPRKQRRTTVQDPKPPTIREVADHAGVSTATVSRVLSGQHVVSDELIERVHSSVDAISYRPNRTPRSMRKRANQLVGVLISHLRDPYFDSVVAGIETVMEENGFTPLLCDTGDDPRHEAMFLSTLRAEGVAGFILAPYRSDSEALRQFVRISPPIVTIDNGIERSVVDTVRPDNSSAAFQATQRLLEAGHRQVALICGPAFATSGQETRQGFCKALETAGLPVNEEAICCGTVDAETGYQQTLQLLNLTPTPTALLAGNNQIALGALRAIRERGLEMPGQMALIGFDDAEWNSLLAPALTVIDRQPKEIGATAARLLVERIAAPRQPAREVVLEVKLIERQSG